MFGIATFFVFLAAVCAAIPGFAMSKTLKQGGHTQGFLVFYFLVSFLVAFLVHPKNLLNHPFSFPLALFGALAGLLIILCLILVGKALKRGPLGLTYAFLNSGAVVPPLFLGLTFSHDFGFDLRIAHMIGMGLVIMGLFWVAVRGKKEDLNKKWLSFAFLVFVVQALILTIFQWRCLLMQEGLPAHLLVPMHCDPKDDLWFMPAMFFFAWILASLFFFVSLRRFPNKVEALGGTFGGIANGLSTYFLLAATTHASVYEKMMLFPLHAALSILFINCLGKVFYREPIHWAANACLIFGIVVGTAF